MSAALKDKKGRKAPPSQYSVKIESLSLLSESVDKYESEEFEAGDYKWVLSIYPTGNKKADGQDHVSIYLVLRDTSSLPVGWEVNAIITFSAYNFLEDEYVTTEDARVRRFHVLKTDWGIPKFVELDIFNDPSNGYLIDDTCVFGVEVIILKLNTTIKGDCLSMIHEPVTVFHGWKFDNFFSAYLERHESQPFIAGNYKWNILFYPDGSAEGKGNSISLFLTLDASSLPPKTKLFVDYTLRAKDQINGKHAEEQWCHNFSNESSSWGSRQFVGSAKFKDSNSGFILGNSCIFEAEVKVLGLITRLSD